MFKLVASGGDVLVTTGVSSILQAAVSRDGMTFPSGAYSERSWLLITLVEVGSTRS